MIGDLRLEGFQSFGLRQDLALQPLTLLFGPNSSGKSSLGRAFRFLKQSASNPTGITFAGDQVNLTSFENTVFKNNSEDSIGLDLTMYPVKTWIREPRAQITTATLQWTFSRQASSLPESISIVVALDFAEQTSDYVFLAFSLQDETVQLQEFLFPDPKDQVSGQVFRSSVLESWGVKEQQRQALVGRNLVDVRDAFLATGDGDGPAQHTSIAKSLDEVNFAMGPDQMRPGPTQNLLPRISNTAQLPRGGIGRFLADLLGQLGSALEQELSNIRYVGPLREIVSGFKSQEGDVPELNSDGSNIQEHLLRIDDEQFAEVSDGVQVLTDGAYELERKTLSESDVVQARSLGSVLLKDKHSDTSVAFQDAGTGIAQVLPIVAAVVDATARDSAVRGKRSSRRQSPGLLIIEQPELHLHPEMQGRLADYLLDKSMTSIRDQGSGPVILCETHSEAFLLRVQRRLREQRFGRGSAKVAFYFVDRLPGSDSSHVMSMEIDDEGEFRQAWPVSFAGLRMKEYRGG